MTREDSAAAELALVSAPRQRRWLRRLVILAIACGLLFAFRFPLMTQAAQWWIISDPLEKADAALVLGGGMDTRPFHAAELYQRGLVPLVLVAEVNTSSAVDLQLIPLESDVSAGVLKKSGVPDAAIQRFGHGVTSTRDEAVAVRQWLERHSAKRLIIPTDPFQTRRIRYIFEHELQGLDVQVIVTAIPSKRYDPLQWWKSEAATINFQNEIIKLVYYWCHK
ncbi:MAG: YdcF family protein [Verrucomicrobia bacterium]|nr:YdcF family protein [Verrucomicrobiota bacterium]